MMMILTVGVSGSYIFNLGKFQSFGILQCLERRTAWILPFSAGGFLNIGLFSSNFPLLGSRGFDQQIIHGVSDLLDALLL